MRVIDAEAVAALGWPAAIAAIRAAAASDSGTTGPPRTVVDVRAGQLAFDAGGRRPVRRGKGGLDCSRQPGARSPRVQGAYLLFDAATLRIAAVLDGVALTTLRTAAVSALAVDLLAQPGEARLVVFGCGPQARAHIEALPHVRPIRCLTIVGRTAGQAEALVQRCAAHGLRRVGRRSGRHCRRGHRGVRDRPRGRRYSSRRHFRPMPWSLPSGRTSRDAREVDSALVDRATVVVESRVAALREAGDIVLAIADGVPSERAIDGDLAELVGGHLTVSADRPRL